MGWGLTLGLESPTLCIMTYIPEIPPLQSPAVLLSQQTDHSHVNGNPVQALYSTPRAALRSEAPVGNYPSHTFPCLHTTTYILPRPPPPSTISQQRFGAHCPGHPIPSKLPRSTLRYPLFPPTSKIPRPLFCRLDIPARACGAIRWLQGIRRFLHITIPVLPYTEKSEIPSCASEPRA